MFQVPHSNYYHNHKAQIHHWCWLQSPGNVDTETSVTRTITSNFHLGSLCWSFALRKNGTMLPKYPSYHVLHKSYGRSILGCTFWMTTNSVFTGLVCTNQILPGRITVYHCVFHIHFDILPMFYWWYYIYIYMYDVCLQIYMIDTCLCNVFPFLWMRRQYLLSLQLCFKSPTAITTVTTKNQIHHWCKLQAQGNVGMGTSVTRTINYDFGHKNLLGSLLCRI